jgi:hypothetical protein
MADVTPVCENSTPTRQLSEWSLADTIKSRSLAASVNAAPLLAVPYRAFAASPVYEK